MLQSLKDFEKYKVSATDGDIGKVTDFLLDDEHWALRYLVVRAGGPLLLNGYKALISPISFRRADRSTEHFLVALTMDGIKSSPHIDVDKPVSRQHERDYHRKYGYPTYWGYSGLWGAGAVPASQAGDGETHSTPTGEPNDVHLRSATELRGYHIQGSDDTIGHVEDFIVDDQNWQIRYLVINTSNWWLGKKVLIAPRWATHVDWSERKVHLDLSREAIKQSPVWNAEAAIDRAYEARLYDHYERPAYWPGTKLPAVSPPLPNTKTDDRSAAKHLNF